jgi:4-hydroxy-3-polyprenylbenzoate decarboxylase
MAYKDLKDWINTLEKEGELSRIKAKVDWDLEMGGIADLNTKREGPALLFENIKDHENTICKKYFSGSLLTYSRIALMMGLPKNTEPIELIKTYMERIKKPVKPIVVKDGAVKQTILKGKDVNLHQFPAPKWHSMDGGRYIGTGDGVITRDPNTGWTNVGLYRREVLDENHMGIVFSPGRHIWMHWRETRKLGAKSLPVAIAVGWDPVLPMIACASTPPQVDEYDVMGAIRGQPVELIKCETNDLLVPANSQIVFEGEIFFDRETFRKEGPFGEYTGYYGSTSQNCPVIQINCVSYQNDPILQGIYVGVPPTEDSQMESINHSANIWAALNCQMMGVTGVNVHRSTGWTNLIIQIDNSYVGQVNQAAAAVWGMGLSNFVGKNIMVVDQDIDIFSADNLMWAFAYRVDPKTDLIQYPHWICGADPVVHPDDRASVAVNFGNRLLIDATKKITRRRVDEYGGEKFAPVVSVDDATKKLVMKRWAEYGLK